MQFLSSFIFVTFLIIILVESPKAQIMSNWDNDSSYYFFQVVDEYLIPNNITFNQNLTKKDILDSLANYLTQLFFTKINNYYEDKRKIAVIVQKIILIKTSDRTFHIAKINIIDPDEVCMTTFFEGSTGGYNTYLTLISNFIQPQLVTPLLDGIVFTYNNEILKEMNHINLEGLISEREIDNLVRRAIKNKN